MFRVRFASIPVSDQQQALEFYRDKLGCTVVTDEPMGEDSRWIEVQPPGGGPLLVLFTPPGQEDRIGSFHNVAFTADDVYAACEQMMERGVEFVEPPSTAEWGGTEAIFQDQDGNRFVIANPDQNG